MKFHKNITDSAVLVEVGRCLTRARLEFNFTQAQLAEEAGVSKRTLERLEAGAVATQLSSFIRVCRTLNLLDRFDVLIPEPMPSPLAQLKLQGKQRQRASGVKISKSPVKKWKWRAAP